MAARVGLELGLKRSFNNIENTGGTVKAMEDSGKQCYRITNGSRLNDCLTAKEEAPNIDVLCRRPQAQCRVSSAPGWSRSHLFGRHCQLRPLPTREVTALEVESQINSRLSRRI